MYLQFSKMGINVPEFETFEQQFIELIGELQTITSSERRLREALRAEATRAESAEAARDAADRAALEARSNAAASAASTAQAAATLAKVHDELAATKMQFELAERHRTVLEEKCLDLSAQLETQSREVKKLRPLQTLLANLQRQYVELQDRVHTSTEDASNEASKLEAEMRRVEKLASGGAELRERARLAAAAHARDRRLAAAELRRAAGDLLHARTEVTKLGALVTELQYRLTNYEKQPSSSVRKTVEDPTAAALAEARTALEVERTGTARLEQALAAALADNASLAARLHTTDNPTAPEQPKPLTLDSAESNAICPIDSFLAE